MHTKAAASRTSSLPLVICLALAGSLAACGGSAAGVEEPDAADPSAAALTYGTQIHALPYGAPNADAPNAEGPTAPTSAAASAHLNYYGGPVVSNARVVAVFWGSNTNGTVKAGIGGFFSAITNSSYFDWLREYNTRSQSIGRGSFAGNFTIAPANRNTHLSNADIQRELSAQITAGRLPAPSNNTIYMTYFPAGVSITNGSSSSCVAGGFCAYHGTFKRGTQNVYYGVHPDFGPGSGCDTGCGRSTLFNNVTSVSSHELVETVTDAAVGLATVFGPPLAWYDPNNGEIGDICNGQQATVSIGGKSYVVQKQWSNARNACVSQ